MILVNGLLNISLISWHISPLTLLVLFLLLYLRKSLLQSFSNLHSRWGLLHFFLLLAIFFRFVQKLQQFFFLLLLLDFLVVMVIQDLPSQLHLLFLVFLIFFHLRDDPIAVLEKIVSLAVIHLLLHHYLKHSF